MWFFVVVSFAAGTVYASEVFQFSTRDACTRIQRIMEHQLVQLSTPSDSFVVTACVNGTQLARRGNQ